MARRSIPAATRTAVLEAVNGGAKITAVAAQYGLSLPTVYRWIKAATVVEQPVETTVA